MNSLVRAVDWLLDAGRSTSSPASAWVLLLQLIGALAAYDVSRAVGVGAPVAQTVRILEAAVSLRCASRSVPAVDADVCRSVAEVETTAAVTVAGAHVAETHPVRQPFPWIPVHR